MCRFRELALALLDVASAQTRWLWFAGAYAALIQSGPPPVNTLMFTPPPATYVSHTTLHDCMRVDLHLSPTTCCRAG